MTTNDKSSANRFRFRMWVKEYKIEDDVIPAHMDYNPKFSQSVTRTCEARNDMTMDMTRGASVRVNDGFNCPTDGVWMQSTGLLDKNGKEIFEGDILEYTNPNFPKRKQPLHQIVWHDRRARFLCREAGKREYKSIPTGRDPNLPDDINADRWEVIGTIYENPDLLPTTI